MLPLGASLLLSVLFLLVRWVRYEGCYEIETVRAESQLSQWKVNTFTSIFSSFLIDLDVLRPPL